MEFIGSREIDVVQVVNARLGVDLVPTLRSAYPSVRVVVDVDGESAPGRVWLTYITSRYGNVVDAFFAWQLDDVARLEAALVSPTRVVHLGSDHEDRDEAAAAAARGALWTTHRRTGRLTVRERLVNRRVRPDADATVSAVIPFFNHGMVVDEALEAIRRQSRPVDEIVVVDDGSTDPYSLSVLARLEDDGVAVVHQHNQGPGSARNLGAEHCAGDAILFLDSDDTVSEHHVERALGALAGAPAEVGFVYPDMQFMGNEHHLVVMPPYNLYLLLHRNFCCMGGLIDRSVFDAGFRFRSDRLVGHEDWDFFVNLGVSGIYGHPFHGAPLGYRRWGFSRSDAVNEESDGAGRGAGTPPRSERQRPADRHQEGVGTRPERGRAQLRRAGRGATRAVTTSRSWCTRARRLPRRGAVGSSCWPRTASARWATRWFVERVIRLASGLAHPAPLYLYRPEAHCGDDRGMAADRPAGRPASAVRHRRWWVPLLGLEGDGRWRHRRPGPLLRSTRCVGRDRARAGGVLGVRRGARCGRSPSPHVPAVAPSARPAQRSDGGIRERSGASVSASGGITAVHAGPWRAPTARGSRTRPRDGLEAIIEQAWLEWMPSRSLQLNLVVDVLGQSTLGDLPAPGRWVGWTPRPRIRRRSRSVGYGRSRFPAQRACCRSRDPSTLAVSYRVSLDGAAAPGDAVLGYVADRVPPRADRASCPLLREALGAVRGPQRVTPPPLADLPASRSSSNRPPCDRRRGRGDRREAVPPPSHRWPLVEAALRNWSRAPRSWTGRARRAIG